MTRILYVLILVVTSGCAAAPSSSTMPPFEGTTTADKTLQRDGYANALMFTGFSGCSSIDRVTVSVVAATTDRPLSAKVTEQWVLHGCEREFPFVVNMNGDGKGGTFITVKKNY